jgi:hypothetical protein
MLTVADFGGALRLGYGAVILGALAFSWAHILRLRAAARHDLR